LRNCVAEFDIERIGLAVPDGNKGDSAVRFQIDHARLAAL
jgi:hypothetical protein